MHFFNQQTKWYWIRSARYKMVSLLQLKSSMTDNRCWHEQKWHVLHFLTESDIALGTVKVTNLQQINLLEQHAITCWTKCHIITSNFRADLYSLHKDSCDAQNIWKINIFHNYTKWMWGIPWLTIYIPMC